MSSSARSLQLLDPGSLVKTDTLDEAAWNYRPLLGWIQRQRFRLAAVQLQGRHYGRLLEVGYGSGIFQPHLARCCSELYGLDRHPLHEKVAKILDRRGITSRLFSSDVTQMPFEDDAFDAIVAISVLEHVPDLAAACGEITRTLRPGGDLIVVTPARSWLGDLGLKVLTGNAAAAAFEDRRERLVRHLLRVLDPVGRRSFPPLGGPVLRLYHAFKLRHTGHRQTPRS